MGFFWHAAVAEPPEPPTLVPHFDLDFVRPIANSYHRGKGAYAETVTVYYSREVWGDRAVFLHESMGGVVERFTIAEFKQLKREGKLRFK
jgi:hypothetical protein